MAKTLREYLFEGGVKGRRFVDPVYTRPNLTIYEVEQIAALGLGGPTPSVSVQGRDVKTNEVYMKNLALCLNHEEYTE